MSFFSSLTVTYDEDDDDDDAETNDPETMYAYCFLSNRFPQLSLARVVDALPRLPSERHSGDGQ